MDKLFRAKVSIHRLGNSIWSMKDVVFNESGKTSVSEQQVLAFQKSWRSFSPITVCIIAQCQCRTGGGGGGGAGGGLGHVPPPPTKRTW